MARLCVWRTFATDLFVSARLEYHIKRGRAPSTATKPHFGRVPEAS
ncbi:MAG: hypothetical protein O3A46_09615 [Candidatus Poribacteria bacterium]|nr:hypothetical protein [Candidatus Poribacteria bacterium]